MSAKSPDQIIGPGGGVSLVRAGLTTVKASSFVLGGYFAAELGGDALRMGLRAANDFGAKGPWQAGLVKAIPGVVVTMLMAALTFKGRMARGGSRSDAMAAAAKVVVLMGIGVGAAVVREPLARLVNDLKARVASVLTKAPAKAAGNNLGAGGGRMRLVQRTAGAESIGNGMYAETGDSQRMMLGGASESRAGGDAGFTAGDAVEVGDIMKTESW